MVQFNLSSISLAAQFLITPTSDTIKIVVLFHLVPKPLFIDSLLVG